jgi:glycosyltransferase involved in cell wall biosynthesis|tara:strand:- start:999 stop:1940 length:942 start_codon:yes stop_codon:yes gene_type:complete
MKLISIVFSFKNEEKNIPELIDRTTKVLTKFSHWNYELIFVNDNSTDNSEQILIKLQKDYPIDIINMSRTYGVGPCVIAGFRHSKGDAIVYMDSDLQDPPELIEKLIKEHENGADVVHTVRTKRLGESNIKMFVTNLAYKIINFFSDIPLPVNAGDFKLISRRALNKILELKEFRPYIRGLSVWVGFKQTIIHYIREPRASGQSQFSLLSSGPVNEFITGLTAYSLKPLYVGIVLGFFSIFISLLLIIHTFYSKFNDLTALGSASILIAISFFSGMILFTQGIIGIYIARIFEQVRGRKKYVIKDVKDHNLKN